MKKTTILLLLAAASLGTAHAQDDNTQASLRENPEIEAAKGDVYVAPAIAYPSYIDTAANHIDMNGADWSELAATLDAAANGRVDIVHIGDSHLQADMGTAVSRNRLGRHYGDAGRALIVPFKLAGTNEPVDYAVTSSVPMTQSRLLKTPWPTAMGFTGIGISPDSEKFDLSISARVPFDSLTVYYSGKGLVPDTTVAYRTVEDGILSISLPDTTSSLSMSFTAPAGVALHGFNLLRGHSGVAYHVIGNNGATYGTYNGVEGFADDISHFKPALIIISLGTNEAFNTTSNEEMRSSMETLISDLRRACPDTPMLLTTPSECQRKLKRRRGRRRRARVTYQVNSNVKRMRDVIIGVGRAEGIPVYDFYNVAGGTGSSFNWLNDKNLNTDRIHMTRDGYTIQGHLFTDALEEALSNARNKKVK